MNLSKHNIALLASGLTVIGCIGPLVAEFDIDAGTASHLRLAVATVTSQELEGRAYEAHGIITATSCFNNIISDTMSSQGHAMDQLRYRASGLGANALLNPVCQDEGTNFAKNCWTSTTCTAGAIRIGAGASSPNFPAVSSGTCFVVTPDGGVLTSAHVVQGASQVTVALADSRTLPAKVVSSSRSTDITMLSIEAHDLPYLTLAPANSAGLGDAVFTVGYPVLALLGEDPKFTDGSISSLTGVGGESTLMQVTVPVQPGNSGGPLVQADGTVIGIVVSTAAVEAFYQETGSLPQNISWAVKADYAMPLFEPPPAHTPVIDRSDAVVQTLAALCRVEATR